MSYTGKHALVLGLGESGLAMAQWLARCGARLRVADTREAPQRLQALQAALPDAEFVGGPFNENLLDQIDFVCVSPGLAPNKELALIAPAAGARGIPVWGEIELFAQALAELKASRGYAPKVVAITGTNGKTTVTSLTGQLCERAGLSTRVAGTIRPAALDVLREVLEADAQAGADAQAAPPTDAPSGARADTLPQAWILELSSFQLHTTYSLNPDAATVLNLTQDHLDWHGAMAAYGADKARIFGADTVRVLNRDDRAVMQMTATGATVVSFGTGEPKLPGCFGLANERGVLWLTVAVPGEESEKKRRKNEAPAPVEVIINRLMPADALRIRGLHNATNALAALALCRAIGLPFAPLLHGLREYHGEPHRVELVTAIDDVDYYDDSKGTNVGATVAALSGLGKAFAGEQQKIVLIAGGDGKGQDFEPLAEPVSRYVRAVLLIGRDAAAIRAALEPAGVALTDCATLEEAVRRAAGLAQAGDCVLLSPACASLDMFTNYAHRAQVFVDAVREIALDKGQDI
ncbi:MAG: UDP-N-acetylmuramoyl-L-alanine--D-glutamate ligase [Massilia sp.]